MRDEITQRIDVGADVMHAGQWKKLDVIDKRLLCCRHVTNWDNYRDEKHFVNRSLIRKYLHE